MRSTRFLLAIFTSMLLTVFVSCNKDEDSPKTGKFTNGMFIVNEGPFQTGTGTITFFNTDSNYVTQDIFELINNRPLGNIAQSMTIYNEKGYISVNNSAKVEVVDVASFKSLGTITNLSNPAFFLGIDETKAYITDWVGHVAIADLNSYTVSKTIPTGTGPDAMLKAGKYVFVANTGGFGIDSTITVIDFTTDKVIKTINVGIAPNGLAVDANGKIWVLCKGKGFAGWPQTGDTPGSLLRIDPNSLNIDYTYTFPSSGDHPDKLVINKQKSQLFFLHNNGIYSFNIALTSSSSVPKLVKNRGYYSLGYDAKSNYLFASDAGDYVSAGKVFRLDAETGAIVDSVEAGIIPRGFAFYKE